MLSSTNGPLREVIKQKLADALAFAQLPTKTSESSACANATLRENPETRQKGPLNGDDCSDPTNPCLKLMDVLAKDGNVFELPLRWQETTLGNERLSQLMVVERGIRSSGNRLGFLVLQMCSRIR